MQLSEMRDSVIGYLATKSTDKAFPPARLNRWLNDECNAMYADLPAGYLTGFGSWSATSATAHSYTLWNQSTPVVGLKRIIDVRHTDEDGASLRECAFDQLQNQYGLFYALVGADEQTTLVTCREVAVGIALYSEYESWPAELSEDAHVPSSLPKRFHDVPCLRAARTGFSAGAESKWPTELRDLLEDREAQFTAHITRRSADAQLQRSAVGVLP